VDIDRVRRRVQFDESVLDEFRSSLKVVSSWEYARWCEDKTNKERKIKRELS
jgi:hypothetical protein